MSRLWRIRLIGFSAALAGCSGGANTPTSPPSEPAATITISAAGASPTRVEVPLGARVLFVNHDIRPHNMSSDPHPDHTDCPEINFAGYLLANQSRETGNLVEARTCGFHDHENPDDKALRGSIIIR